MKNLYKLLYKFLEKSPDILFALAYLVAACRAGK